MDMKDVWIKVVEYASKPHLGISRKMRAGYGIEFNGDGTMYEGDVVFEIYETYLRVIVEEGSTTTNLYFDLDKIVSIRTAAKK